MPVSQINGLPGFRSTRSADWRRVRVSDNGRAYIRGGVIISGSKSRDAGNTANPDVLRPGKIMVKEASGGLYRPFIIGKTTAAYADNDTTLTVPAGVATEVARLIVVAGAAVSLALIGPPIAAGTVAETAISVTAASGTTLTIADLNLNKVTDSLIAIASGNRTAGSFCLVDDGTGIKTTDQDGNSLNQPFPNALIGGELDTSQILDWPADTATVTYLKGLLNSGVSGYRFAFDDAL